MPLDLALGPTTGLAISSHIELLKGQDTPYPETFVKDGLVPEPEYLLPSTPGLILGKLITKVRPDYPILASSHHVQGLVQLAATVDQDGHVLSVSPVYAADPLLVDAAVQAVKRWSYAPSQLNGAPAAIEQMITIDFNINR